MCQIISKPLSFYVDPILAGKPYSFARYGDGEWASTLDKRKHPQKNCDGHFFFPEMRDDFRALFRDLHARPQDCGYLLGMQNMVMRMWSKRIKQFLQQYDLQTREWYDADVFHHASRKGKLAPLIEALKQARVIIVGPGHLRALDRVFGYNEFVQVPHQNCYLQLERVLAQTRKAINKAIKPVVVAISASMPAEIIIHRLYKGYGKHAFLIDFGSVFDPYTGVVSRQYQQGMSPDVIRAISPGTQPTVAAGSVKCRLARKVGRSRRR